MSTAQALSPAHNQPSPEQILQRLDWRVIRRLDGLLQGDYRTLFYGDGLDFADLREYQLEDDIRHIDWNVTARMNTLHVRQYVEDREITSWFLLDLSPSMGFGPVGRPKEAVLIDLVTTLSRLLTRNGNRVGAILYNNRNSGHHTAARRAEPCPAPDLRAAQKDGGARPDNDRFKCSAPGRAEYLQEALPCFRDFRFHQ